jgi:hypothetical protein
MNFIQMTNLLRFINQFGDNKFINFGVNDFKYYTAKNI